MNKAEELTQLADSNRAAKTVKDTVRAEKIVGVALDYASKHVDLRTHSLQLRTETELTQQTVVELLEDHGFDPEICRAYITIFW